VKGGEGCLLDGIHLQANNIVGREIYMHI